MWAYWIGNHQKINKVALQKLATLTSTTHFPNNRRLRYFEGRRGPDSIKVKSPGEDEPHAFYDPFDEDDTLLVESITNHYKNLVKELKDKNQEKAAFEASWLAHTLVDGLTPAHHFPYESELANLNADKEVSIKLGDTVNKKRNLVTARGDSTKDVLKNNWGVYGFKGVIITHHGYEGGVAFMTRLMSFKDLEITMNDVNKAKKLGLEEYFEQTARQVALMGMYDHFYRYGWTASLARQTRDELMPILIKTVCVAWYLAMQEAGLTSRKSHADK